MKTHILNLARLAVVYAIIIPYANALSFCAGKDPVNSPNDVMVKVGSICVDKYEASVWSLPKGQGVKYPQPDPRFPATFPENGNWTVKLYATSKPNASPSTFITWFQAQQACALSGKRLLTNAEWQMVAAGTPDPGLTGNGVTQCNTNTNGSVLTGSAANCVSNWGANDMVGNVQEWVADWLQGPGNSASNGTYITNDWTPAALTISSLQYGQDRVDGINGALNQAAHQSSQGTNYTPEALPSAVIRGGMWSSRRTLAYSNCLWA